ncbi:MAG: hypothetical protein LQ343_005612 [Gyalolechia ehrenbergii]|nr:MAG: hypothetical protein LQ343_005612 [Gyalolechia ehrenbergii]
MILPILTGLGIQGAQSILTRSDNSLLKRRSLPSWVLPICFVVLVVYDTVIATLAATQIIPSEVMTCGLFQRWQSLWSTHNAEAIKRIQDAHNCCGFKTIKDRAWPFAGNDGADRCSIMYEREQNCLPGWQRDQQINAGLILLVAIGTFLVKANISEKGGVLVLYRGRDPLMQRVRRGYAALTAGDNDVEGGHQAQESRRSQGRIEAPYHDEVASDAGTEDVDTERDGQARAQGGSRNQDSNMVLQPSSIQDDDNAWRR